MRYVLRCEFKVYNNEAYHEALIVGLERTLKLRIGDLRIHCGSQLIVKQVKGDYAAKEPHIIVYLVRTPMNLESFSWFDIQQVTREENTEPDAFTHLSSGIDEDSLAVQFGNNRRWPARRIASVIEDSDRQIPHYGGHSLRVRRKHES